MTSQNLLTISSSYNNPTLYILKSLLPQQICDMIMEEDEQQQQGGGLQFREQQQHLDEDSESLVDSSSSPPPHMHQNNNNNNTSTSPNNSHDTTTANSTHQMPYSLADDSGTNNNNQKENNNNATICSNDSSQQDSMESLTRVSAYFFQYLMNDDGAATTSSDAPNDTSHSHLQFFSKLTRYFMDALLLGEGDAEMAVYDSHSHHSHAQMQLGQVFQMPFSSLSNNKSDTSLEATLLDFLLRVMDRFTDKLPQHVIAALQMLLISYMGIFYHFRNKDLSQQHIFRFRMRMIDFVHVLLGFLIEKFEERHVSVPEEMRRRYHDTRWRPFGGVIPFCCHKEYAGKFPVLLSVKHGVIRWYLPKTPLHSEEDDFGQHFSDADKDILASRSHQQHAHNDLDRISSSTASISSSDEDDDESVLSQPESHDTQSLQSKTSLTEKTLQHRKHIHKALAMDQEQLETLFHELLRTDDTQQLHFPHKKIDVSQLIFEDAEGSIRVKPTMDLAGTTEELQLLLQRMIANELTSPINRPNSASDQEVDPFQEMNDHLESTDMKLLDNILKNFASADSQKSHTQSITEDLFPTFQMLYAMNLLDQKLSSAKQQSERTGTSALLPGATQHTFQQSVSDIHSLYHTVSTFVSSSLNLIQKLQKKEGFFAFHNRASHLFDSKDVVQFVKTFDAELIGGNQMKENPLYPISASDQTGSSSEDFSLALPKQLADDENLQQRIAEEHSMRRQSLVHTSRVMGVEDAALRLQQHMTLSSVEDTYRDIVRDVMEETRNLTDSNCENQIFGGNSASTKKLLLNQIEVLQQKDSILSVNSLPHQNDTVDSNHTSLLENNQLKLRELVSTWTNLAQYVDSSTYFNSSREILDNSKVLNSVMGHKEQEGILNRLVIQSREPQIANNLLLASFKKIIETQIRDTELERSFDMVNKKLEWDYYQSYFDGSPLFTHNIDASVDIETEDGFKQFIDRVVPDLRASFDLIRQYGREARDSEKEYTSLTTAEADRLISVTRKVLLSAVSQLELAGNATHTVNWSTDDRNSLSETLDTEQQNTEFTESEAIQLARKVQSSTLCSHYNLSEDEYLYHWKESMSSEQEALPLSEVKRMGHATKQIIESLKSQHNSYSVMNASQTRLLRLTIVTLLMNSQCAEMGLDLLFALSQYVLYPIQKRKLRRMSSTAHNGLWTPASLVECVQLLTQFVTLEISRPFASYLKENVRTHSIVAAKDLLTLLARREKTDEKMSLAEPLGKSVGKAIRLLTLNIGRLDCQSMISVFPDLLYLSLILIHVDCEPELVGCIQDLLRHLFASAVTLISQSNSAVAKLSEVVVDSLLHGSLGCKPEVSESFAPLIKLFLEQCNNEDGLVEMRNSTLDMIQLFCLPFVPVDDAFLWKHRKLLTGSYRITKDIFYSQQRIADSAKGDSHPVDSGDENSISEQLLSEFLTASVVDGLATYIFNHPEASELDILQRCFKHFLYLETIGSILNQSRMSLVEKYVSAADYNQEKGQYLVSTLSRCSEYLDEKVPVIASLLHLSSLHGNSMEKTLVSLWKGKWESCAKDTADNLSAGQFWEQFLLRWRESAVAPKIKHQLAFIYYDMLHHKISQHTDILMDIPSFQSMKEEVSQTLLSTFQQYTLSSIHEMHFSQSQCQKVHLLTAFSRVSMSKDVHFWSALQFFMSFPSLDSLHSLFVEDYLLSHNEPSDICFLSCDDDMDRSIPMPSSLVESDASKSQQLPRIATALYQFCMQFSDHFQKMVFTVKYYDWLHALAPNKENPDPQVQSQSKRISRALKFHLFQTCTKRIAYSNAQKPSDSIVSFWRKMQFALPRVSGCLIQLSKYSSFGRARALRQAPELAQLIEEAMEDLKFIETADIPSVNSIMKRIDMICESVTKELESQEVTSRADINFSTPLEEQNAFEEVLQLHEKLDQLRTKSDTSKKSVADLFSIHVTERDLWQKEEVLRRHTLNRAKKLFGKGSVDSQENTISWKKQHLLEHLLADYIRCKRILHIALLRRHHHVELKTVSRILVAGQLSPVYRDVMENLLSYGSIHVKSSVESMENFFSFCCQDLGVSLLDSVPALLLHELRYVHKQSPQVPVLNILMSSHFKSSSAMKSTLHFFRRWLMNRFAETWEKMVNLTSGEDFTSQHQHYKSKSNFYVLQEKLKSTQLRELIIVSARWWPEFYAAMLSCDRNELKNILNQENPLYVSSCDEMGHFTAMFVDLFQMTNPFTVFSPSKLRRVLAPQLKFCQQLYGSLCSQTEDESADKMMDHVVACEILVCEDFVDHTPVVLDLLQKFILRELRETDLERATRFEQRLLLHLIHFNPCDRAQQHMEYNKNESEEMDSENHTAILDYLQEMQQLETRYRKRSLFDIGKFFRIPSPHGRTRLFCVALHALFPKLPNLLKGQRSTEEDRLLEARLALIKSILTVHSSNTHVRTLSVTSAQHLVKNNDLFAELFRSKVITLRKRDQFTSSSALPSLHATKTREYLIELWKQCPVGVTLQLQENGDDSHLSLLSEMGNFQNDLQTYLSRSTYSLLLYESARRELEVSSLLGASPQLFCFHVMSKMGILDLNSLDELEEKPEPLFLFSDQSHEKQDRKDSPKQDKSIQALPNESGRMSSLSLCVYTLQLILQKSKLDGDQLFQFLFKCCFQTDSEKSSLPLCLCLLQTLLDRTDYSENQWEDLLVLLDNMLVKVCVLFHIRPMPSHFYNLCWFHVFVQSKCELNTAAALPPLPTDDSISTSELTQLIEEHTLPRVISVHQLKLILSRISACRFEQLLYPYFKTLMGNFAAFESDAECIQAIVENLSNGQAHHLNLLALWIPVLMHGTIPAECNVSIEHFNLIQLIQLFQQNRINASQLGCLLEGVLSHFRKSSQQRDTLIQCSAYFPSFAACLDQCIRMPSSEGNLPLIASRLKRDFVRFLRFIKKLNESSEDLASFSLWSSLEEVNGLLFNEERGF